MGEALPGHAAAPAVFARVALSCAVAVEGQQGGGDPMQVRHALGEGLGCAWGGYGVPRGPLVHMR